MKYILVIFISITLFSCVSQKEREYKKAVKSNDIEFLTDFIISYPKHKDIERIIYRLRVIEYEKVKKSNNLLFWKHFIKRYRSGKDVDEIKTLYFEYKIKEAKDDLQKIKKVKTIFLESRFQKIINEKIFKIESKLILNESDITKLEKFIRFYPTSPIVDKLQEKIDKIKLKKLLLSKNIDEINDFLTINPKLNTKEVKDELKNIIFNHYSIASKKELQFFLENNKNYERYNELESIYVDKTYKELIAFFRKNELLKFDKIYKLNKYKKDIAWFKKSKKVKRAQKLIKILLTKMEYTNKDELNLFSISLDSLQESLMIIKMFSFNKDLTDYLRKSDSYFIMVQLATLKALNLFLQSDIPKNEKLFYEKIKSLKLLKSKNYKMKILTLYFVLNDIKNFKKQLEEISNYNDLWIKFLTYYFLNGSDEKMIELINEAVVEHQRVIKSQNRIVKNKLDRENNLYYINKMFIHVLKNIKRKKVILSLKLAKKVEIIRANLKNIKKINPFYNFEEYKKREIKAYQELNKIAKITPLLRKYLLLNHPLISLKELLPKTDISTNYNSLICIDKENSICKEKENFFNIFLK